MKFEIMFNNGTVLDTIEAESYHMVHDGRIFIFSDHRNIVVRIVPVYNVLYIVPSK